MGFSDYKDSEVKKLVENEVDDDGWAEKIKKEGHPFQKLKDSMNEVEWKNFIEGQKKKDFGEPQP